MASKGFTDHLIGFVDKAFEVLEEATIRVLDKLDEPEESPAEEAFEPTAGYLPCIGDTVAIKPESEVLVGLVQEVKRELRTTQVVAMDGAEHAFSWWVPWGSV